MESNFEILQKKIAFKDELKDEALAALLQLESGENPDDFLFGFMETVDFSKISPLETLLALACISPTNPFLQKIVDLSIQYISTLIATPELFSPNYNFNRAALDFEVFLVNSSYSTEWFSHLLTKFDENSLPIFEQILFDLSERVYFERISSCIPALRNIRSLIQFPAICSLLVKSPQYEEFFFNIFSLGIFAIDTFTTACELLGDNPKYLPSPDTMNIFDKQLTAYHDELFEVMRILLLAPTANETLTVIQASIKKAAKVGTSGFPMQCLPKFKRYESFAYNLEIVLVRLALINRDNWRKVDPLTPYLAKSWSPLLKTDGFSLLSEVPPEEKDTEFFNLVAKRNEENQNKPPKFVSTFFFLALQAIDACTCSLIRTMDHQIGLRIYEFETAIANHAGVPMVLEKIKKNLEYNHLSFLVGILMPSHRLILTDFLTTVLDFLLHVGGFDSYNDRFTTVLPKTPPLEFAHLPSYVFSSCIEPLSLLISKHCISQPNSILEKLVLLFSAEEFIRLPELKAKIVQLFIAVTKDPNNKYLVVGIPKVLQLMFPAIINFFSSVQITSTTSQFYERFSYRDACTSLLKFWFGLSEFRQAFIQSVPNDQSSENAQISENAHISENDRISEKVNGREFLYHLVDDTTRFADQSIALLETIHKDAEENTQEARSEISHSRMQLATWIAHVNVSLELISTMVKFTPESFLIDVVELSFVRLLLCLIVASVEKAEIMTIENPKEIHFDPWFLFQSSCEISSIMGNDQKFLKLFAECGFYSDKVIDGALNKLKAKRTYVPESTLNEFEEFVRKVKQQKVLVDEENQKLMEAKDEYYDELTYDLMEEPMKLPSGHVLDRKTILRQLFEKPVDPFTQVPLKIEDCVPLEDLKKEIQEFMKKA